MPLRKEDKVKKRVACLYRVSTKNQVDVSKNDIPMQKTACHEFAERQGWIITEEHSEKGVSGFKTSANNRDAIQDLKKSALNGEFDILLVFMFDRIGRIDDETPFVVEWFTKHGIEVWSVSEGEQRFDNHVDKLTNYIRFWQASGESAKTSMRIKTRMQQLVTEGCYTGGVTPFGYKLIKKGRVNKKGTECYDLAIEETEAEYVRLVFEKTIRDGYGSHRLAELLNKQGVKTHNGAKFQCNTILRILRNRIYTGHYTSRDFVSPKIKELEIISDELFEKAQYILEQRSAKNDKKREISRTTKGQTLLAGNIYCKSCGNRIISSIYTDRYVRKNGELTETKKNRYICYQKSHKLCECQGQSAYIADKIDTAVIATIRDMFIRIKDKPQTVALEKKVQSRKRTLNSEKKKLLAELDKSNKQLEKLQLEIVNSLAGDSDFTTKDLSSAMKTVESKVAGIESRIAEIDTEIEQQSNAISKIGSMYGDFLGWANEFDNATLEQKKMIVCQLIKRVEINKGYEIHIEFNMDYEQFCLDWAG